MTIHEGNFVAIEEGAEKEHCVAHPIILLGGSETPKSSPRGRERPTSSARTMTSMLINFLVAVR